MDLNLNFKDIKIEEINLTFEKYLSELDITDDLKLKCNEAEILLLPPNLEGNTYPEITGDLFQYLKNNLPAEVKIELPVEDENYGETRFYGEPISIIATFFIKNIAIPILVEVLAHFIIKKLKSRKNKKEKVKFIFIVESNKVNKSKKVEFIGDKESFADLMSNSERIFNDN